MTGIEEATARLVEIEGALRTNQQDGPLYEDEYVKVERKDGEILMTGKPFRACLHYEEAPADAAGKS